MSQEGLLLDYNCNNYLAVACGDFDNIVAQFVNKNYDQVPAYVSLLKHVCGSLTVYLC
jgi:hypothetical protein